MNPLIRIFSHYCAKLQSDGFARNVLVMFTGTAIGQFGSVLLSPFLTRIYSPEMFGILGIYMAVVGIASVLATLRYEMALPLVQSDSHASDLLAVCIFALFGTTALFVLAILGISTLGNAAAILGPLAPYRWLMPAGFFCIGAYQAMIAYATRQGAFPVIARTKVYQGCAGPLSQICMGLAGMRAWGLILGYIIGQSTGITRLFSQLVIKPGVLHNVSLSGMRTMATRFRHFFFLSTWSGLINVASGTYLLLITIPILYSETVVGFVFLTDRLIGRPLLLISTSILQVYVGDVSKSLSSDPVAVKRRFLQMAGRQLIIVASWLALVNMAAPYVIPALFGKQWADTVPYLHVLSIAYLPQMVMHAITHTLQILEKQGLSALWEIGRFTALLGAFAASYTLGFDAWHALLAYSVVQALAQVILFLLMYRSIQSLQKAGKNE